MTPSRYPLIQAPTPLHPLFNAGRELGIDLWIKRDDLTGFAMGGNKGRKIEYILGDALSRRARKIVTCGAAESNFVRQLAVGCQMARIEFHAVVMERPFEPGFEVLGAPPKGNANQKIALLAGATFHRMENGPWETLFKSATNLARELGAFEIPIGGSTPLGALAFYHAAAEVPGFDVILHASSSGSTQMGLHVAFSGSNTHVLGISCDPEEALIEDHTELGRGLCRLLGMEEDRAEGIDLRFDWVGPGYGVPSDAGQGALRWLLSKEGIVLDPIYSGKAFAALLDIAKSGEFGGKRVLFWHTGGTPAFFNA